MQQKAEPEIFDKAYTGMGGEAGGVVGMLEVIESDLYTDYAGTWKRQIPPPCCRVGHPHVL